ncbi:MAG: hypothetical protein NC412_12735 [Roseburia sp.]|nr:hypothetical protein [Roseburia sp.]MCM1279644.1 hypothetical protein [Robinsoniella sp.]
MNKREFEYAMKRGLGRCVLELQDNEDIERFRDIVLKGCLNNYSYDTQCEGTRSEYMYVLQSYYGDTYFEEKIIERFSGKITDVWLFDHLANLLYLFADDGSKKAYKAMLCKYNYIYTRLRKNTSRDTWEQFEWLCVWLVTLEGFERFKKIVSDLADYYERKNETDPYSFDWFWSACKNHYCDESMMKQFIAENDRKGIRIFEDSLSNFVYERKQGEKQLKEEQKPEIPTPEQLIEECNSTKKSERMIYLRKRLLFGAHATEQQAKELAEVIVHLENDKSLQAGLLRVFYKRAFPLDVGYLIRYAEDEDKVLREAAMEALSIVKDERVREYAYGLVGKERSLEYAIGMLFGNYRKEDDGTILKLLKKQKVCYWDGVWHGVFSDALDWLEANPDAPVEAAYYLYEHTLCSCCREWLVELMMDRGIMTEDIRRECEYDSNDDIREKVI